VFLLLKFIDRQKNPPASRAPKLWMPSDPQ
jgi:hypothetical protein